MLWELRTGQFRIFCKTSKFQFSKQTHNIIHLKRSWQRPVPRHETLHKNMKKVMFLLAVGVMCLTGCAQKKGRVWRIVHFTSCRRDCAHPFSSPADCVGQKLPLAYHQPRDKRHRQKNMAMETIN